MTGDLEKKRLSEIIEGKTQSEIIKEILAGNITLDQVQAIQKEVGYSQKVIKKKVEKVISKPNLPVDTGKKGINADGEEVF